MSTCKWLTHTTIHLLCFSNVQRWDIFTILSGECKSSPWYESSWDHSSLNAQRKYIYLPVETILRKDMSIVMFYTLSCSCASVRLIIEK